MNKELVIHVVIGASVVAVIYYLWKQNQTQTRVPASANTDPTQAGLDYNYPDNSSPFYGPPSNYMEGFYPL